MSDLARDWSSRAWPLCRDMSEVNFTFAADEEPEAAAGLRTRQQLGHMGIAEGWQAPANKAERALATAGARLRAAEGHTSGTWQQLDRSIARISRTAAQNGRALQHASAELKADKEVVLAAVAQYGGALQHASAELRANKEVAAARRS